MDGIKAGRNKIGQTGRNLERSTKKTGLNGPANREKAVEREEGGDTGGPGTDTLFGDEKWR